MDQQTNALPEATAAIFEERAENLSREDLANWSTDTAHDTKLISALSGPGAKLLSGPRGCGKSTLLRKTYFRLLSSRDAMPVYVNYSKSLALEPLFFKQANAPQLFRQWILAKIIQGVSGSFNEVGKAADDELAKLAAWAETLIYTLETGGKAESLTIAMSPGRLVPLLDQWAEMFGSRRSVLLLDDAAHAFSQEQQKDFFEIFREMKSRAVAAKAAVYPGVTRYSPHFHIGHEAELLEAWMQPVGQTYLDVMWSVVERRMPPVYLDQLRSQREICDLIALASFGIPRGFLNMIAAALGMGTLQDGRGQLNRSRAIEAIREHAESIRAIYQALSKKLPRYKRFVEIAGELDHRAISLIRSYNTRRTVKTKAVTFAIQEGYGPEVERIVGFLEYAGAIRRGRTVSKGDKGVFRRFDVHYALLIGANAASLGMNYTTKELVNTYLEPNAQSYARGSAANFLGENYLERCTLDLPPCPQCDAPRASPDARFCVNCGKELVGTSVYEGLLKASVSDLPLTEKKIRDLKRAGLSTVQDVVMDDENTKLRAIPYVGEVWAGRIRNAAEEFLSV